MIPILIDTMDLSSEFNLSKKEIDGLLEYTIKQLTTKIATEWQTQAKLNLFKTRNQYMRSIHIVDKGRFEGQIKLIGWLPNKVESGMSGFDMKDGFARSPKRKFNKKGGWYLTIPFTHATPGAIGDAEIFTGGKLPESVYKVAKKLKAGESLKLSQIPEKYQVPKTRERIVLKSKAFEAYKNKSSKYAGIQRNTRPNYGGYVSFRRVSENSDENSWIHSGIIARNLADKALGNIDIPGEVDKSIDDYLSNMGF